MDVRFTPLVGPTCHSPLSPFPPFFFLQEGASHGAELPPAVCRPLREARRHGAELQPARVPPPCRPHLACRPCLAAGRRALGPPAPFAASASRPTTAPPLRRPPPCPPPLDLCAAAAMASSAGALLRRGRRRCPSPPWPRPCSCCWCWLPSPRRSPARPRSRRRRSSRRCSLQAFRPHKRALGWRDGREMGAWGSREERRERDGAVTGERRRVRAERSELVRQISWDRANPHLHRIYLSWVRSVPCCLHPNTPKRGSTHPGWTPSPNQTQG